MSDIVFTFFTAGFFAVLVGLFAGAFFARAFDAGVLLGFFIVGLETFTLFFLLRYFELSNARIGMNTILRKRIPSPKVQCFQKFLAILK